jgi:hypothetical protein
MSSNFWREGKPILDVKAHSLIEMREGKMKKLLCILFILIFASSASAAIYKWVDERGVANYTDSLEKVPQPYRDRAEEIKVPKPPTQSLQPGKTSTKPPPIGQTLVREGDFAIKLAEAFKLGQARGEAEAENMLASAGIAPKNGWIADYPVTPDIIGELQNTVGDAVDSGKLAMRKDEAAKAFQDLIAQQNIPVRADAESQSQYAGIEQLDAEAPPQNYPEYYEPSAIDNYYYDQGPPIVTYYPPPWDYYYLYAWVPYPFWFGGFWFPGFFCLHDFHRGIFFNGHVRFVSNHFLDSRTRGFGIIDPAARRTGNAAATIPHRASGFSSQSARNGASSILSRSSAHTAPNRATGGTFRNMASSGLSNFRGGVSSVRPSTGKRSPSTGYSAGKGGSFDRSTYSGSSGHWRSFSSPRMGTARSFGSSSGSGTSGFHSGSLGSRGFSGGGGDRGGSGFGGSHGGDHGGGHR